MDSNPCTTRCIMKKLGRKKNRTKLVHKNVSQGYDKVKRHIMKDLHLCSYQIRSDFKEKDI